MRCLQLFGRLLALVGLACVCFHAAAWAEEPAAPDLPATLTLAELVVHMQAYQGDFMALSAERRLAFIPQIVAAFEISAGVDGKGLKFEDVEPLVVCAGYLFDYDFGDRPAQYMVCQRITLAGLIHIDQLPQHKADRLIDYLQMASFQLLSVVGQPIESATWQALRNEILRHRLRMYTRIEKRVDPTWDPKVVPKQVSAVGARRRVGLDEKENPERVVEHARDEAAYLQWNQYQEQKRVRHDLESQSNRLRYRLPGLYRKQTVSRADIERLEFELRAAVGNEKLRGEVLQLAIRETAAIVEQAPNVVAIAPELSAYELYRAEFDELNRRAGAGDVDTVAAQMAKLQTQFQQAELAPWLRVQAALGAMSKVAQTPVGNNDLVRERIKQHMLAALEETQPVDLADVELLNLRMWLIVYAHSHSNQTPESIAELSLDAWQDLSAALQKFGPFDPRLPLDEQPQLPAPPAGYADWFSVVQDPAAREDAELFQRYQEFFAQRTEHIRNGNRAMKFAEQREQWFPRLKKMLRAAYAGSRELEQAGAAAITQRISNLPAREALIECLSAASINRDRLDALDKKHDDAANGVADDDPFGGSSPAEQVTRHAQPPAGAPPLTVAAPKGAHVVRGLAKDGSVQLVAELAKAYAEMNPYSDIHVAEDKFASYARLCDKDQPYHAVIVSGQFNDYDRTQQMRRAEEIEGWEPARFLLGQRRVLLVVNKANPIESMNFAYIARTFGPDGPTIRWQDAGGKGNEVPRAYGQAADSWASLYLQQTCMVRMRETQPGAYSKQKLPYREDLVTCESARQVMERVSADPHGIGFLAWNSELKPEDFNSVKLLAIASGKEPAVAATLAAEMVIGYDLAQSVYLYVLPDAPKQVREFALFAASPAGAAIAQKLGAVSKPPKRPGR